MTDIVITCYILQIGLSYVALFIIPYGIHIAPCSIMNLSISNRIRNDYIGRPVMS